jgi:riboflavin biosynthesis pyrimidine reductase
MLSEIGIRNTYVDGGLTIQSFILAHLLDEIKITLVPILLGDGNIPIWNINKRCLVTAFKNYYF